METINELSTEVPNEVPSIIKNKKKTFSKGDFTCERCMCKFRDKYNFERHVSRKNPCKEKDEKNKKVDIGIKFIDNSSLEHIKPKDIIDLIKEIIKEVNSSYARCGYLIAGFHKLVCNEHCNKNIQYKNYQLSFIKIYSKKGWIQKTVEDTIDNIIKIRAEELLSIEDDIINYKPSFLQNEDIKKIWNHLQEFRDNGTYYENEDITLINDDEIKRAEYRNSKDAKRIYERMRLSLLS